MLRYILKHLVPKDDGEPLVFGEESVVFAPVEKLLCSGADASADSSSAECREQS